MLDIHLTDFYSDIGKIFIYLYNRFPRQDTLWLMDICGEDNIDEYGLHSKRYLACLNSVLFLQEEGFLRYSDMEKQDGFNHSVLTLKAFKLLTSPTKESGTPLIDCIRLAAQQGSSTLMEEFVKEALFS